MGRLAEKVAISHRVPARDQVRSRTVRLADEAAGNSARAVKLVDDAGRRAPARIERKPNDIVQALNAGAGTYAATEATNVSPFGDARARRAGHGQCTHRGIVGASDDRQWSKRDGHESQWRSWWAVVWQRWCWFFANGVGGRRWERWCGWVTRQRGCRGASPRTSGRQSLIFSELHT